MNRHHYLIKLLIERERVRNNVTIKNVVFLHTQKNRSKRERERHIKYLKEREREMLSPHERKTVRDKIYKILSGFGFGSMEKERSGKRRVYGKRANTDWYVFDRDQECVWLVRTFS